MNQKYRKGARFEYVIKEKLEKQGYLVIRSAGSKGVFDLLAIAPRGEEILGIQCKVSGRITSSEKRELIEVARNYGIKPCVAFSRERKHHIIDVEKNERIEI